LRKKRKILVSNFWGTACTLGVAFAPTYFIPVLFRHRYSSKVLVPPFHILTIDGGNCSRERICLGLVLCKEQKEEDGEGGKGREGRSPGGNLTSHQNIIR
jgi:hypothetical protein